ncbi:XRE family transcriptional regulator [cyanobacterium endosymbiont of Rhopalodia gibberula]|uniref:helix-turn-helix domain-containing protein n=1 Tax=cyanobacterium endosymbiont of Rhopalodia gibberula TaxID=1763363 RepID=UPI000DC740A4|nr:helix-turn-helix transcriptional regulator [cyanobacterium endosymbiont of Rhopalodia gibberula]BBA80073.1 XRE family transcriptional regulator [cyanobacterium endosymbiont of Rhopalodia gibberula]
MKQSTTYQANYQNLLQLMQRAQISNFSQLTKISGVSQWQLNRLLVGLLPKMTIENLLRLSKVLKVPIEQLLSEFCKDQSLLDSSGLSQLETQDIDLSDLEKVRQEYQQLQQQLNEQKEILEKDFQKSSLEALESWLLQWPTAAMIAHKNPQLSAVKLLPLVKPIIELLKQWNVETIAVAGEKVPYDPLCHQLLEGSDYVEPGETVIIRYIGYRHGENLLYKAKVSPVKKIPAS